MKVGKAQKIMIGPQLTSLAYTKLWDETQNVISLEIWHDLSKKTWDKVNPQTRTITNSIKV